MDGDYLHQMVLNFSAGQLKDHAGSSESLTSDQVILDAIKHYHIEFEANTPVQPYPPKQIHFSPSEREIITEEISILVSFSVKEFWKKQNMQKGTSSQLYLCGLKRMAATE